MTDAPSPACPFDPDLWATDCCGTRVTECCGGPKPDCTVAIAWDAMTGRPDVVVCANGFGCNVYGDKVTPEDPAPDAWLVEDDANVEGSNG